MKREARKPSRRKPARSTRQGAKGHTTNVSGGADLKGQNIGIGGDVVGRDKMVAGDDIVVVGKGGQLVNINLPRSVQIAIGTAAAAIVLIAVAIVTRPQPVVVNGSFETGNTDGWTTSGSIEVVATNEAASSASSQYAAQFQIGASIEQTVTVPIENPQLTVSYRSPDGGARGALNIRLNGEVAVSVANPGGNMEWKTVTYSMTEYAGQEVRLRIEYAASSARAGGLLRLPMQQLGDVLWVTNIAITSSREPVSAATIEPSATPSPTRIAPIGLLSLSYTENGKTCRDSIYYDIAFTVSARGGSPPYTYYRDDEQIGGPTGSGIQYTLTAGETSAAVGTFIVVDSAGRRAEVKFFSRSLDCP